MEQRDSLDRSSSEHLPVATAPNGPLNDPQDRLVTSIANPNESASVVNSVLQSDVRLIAAFSPLVVLKIMADWRQHLAHSLETEHSISSRIRSLLEEALNS